VESKSWQERHVVRERAATVSCGVDAFVTGFEAPEHSGTGSMNCSFRGSPSRLCSSTMPWFVQRELVGVAGLDDLVDPSQVKLPKAAKLELATHSEALKREVFRPLLADAPPVAPAIAESALLRLTAGDRCFAA
jgi:hypothetical protein